MTDLLPCPFCGGAAVAITGPAQKLWGVTCLRCACWFDDRALTDADAIAAGLVVALVIITVLP
jgi:hypothetical protein